MVELVQFREAVQFFQIILDHAGQIHRRYHDFGKPLDKRCGASLFVDSLFPSGCQAALALDMS